MSKTDSFLSNECMKAITELTIKYPNDMDFGKAVRGFVQDANKDNDFKPVRRPNNQPDMGDVNEF